MKTTIEERKQYAKELKNVMWELGKSFQSKNKIPPNRLYAGINVLALMQYFDGVGKVVEGEQADTVFGWKVIEVTEPDYLAVGLVSEQN
ncbi:hypothetical protein BC01_118 [Bacillus phage BC01]|nr:hypothetical protein BC01_118 [Bacillus phage BC01]